eukprot:TRINITY_DN3442_c0_g2_i1.p1 TRINITY_DN3442_c0_g2~~TRINITY_DN3442_c0_g2_i1.p1  ORF type:complete len:310 (+),score=46.78 TRINITY_DN3442_c0_g2_i1:65-994(+)
MIPNGNGNMNTQKTISCTLLTLPYEILLGIFYFLKVKELLNLCLVCKDLKEKIYQESVWKPLLKSDFPKVEASPFEKKEKFGFYSVPSMFLYLSEFKKAKQPSWYWSKFECPRLPRSSDKWTVVFFGSGGTGNKSAFIIQLVHRHFCTEYDPTIENMYSYSLTVDDEVWNLDLLDTAGQEEYSAMRDQYVRMADGFVVGYSITSRESFKDLTSFLDPILAQKKISSLAEFPIVIIGNKADLDKDRVVSFQEGFDLAFQHGIPFFETSCKTRQNVDETMLTICRRMKLYYTPQFIKQKKKKKSMLSLIHI